MAGSDITIEILKDIWETTRATNARLDSMELAFSRRLDTTNERLEVVADRLDVVTERLDVMSERLDLVETTLIDVARQNRLIMRHTRILAKPHDDIGPRVSALEGRVDKLESE